MCIFNIFILVHLVASEIGNGNNKTLLEKSCFCRRFNLARNHEAVEISRESLFLQDSQTAYQTKEVPRNLAWSNNLKFRRQIQSCSESPIANYSCLWCPNDFVISHIQVYLWILQVSSEIHSCWTFKDIYFTGCKLFHHSLNILNLCIFFPWVRYLVLTW